MNIKFTNEVAVTATVVWAVAVIHSPVLAAALVLAVAVVLLAAVMTLVLPTTPEDGRRGTILGLNTRLLVYSHTLGLSDSGKITITVDSCELFTIYDTITINYNIIVNNL